MISFKTFLVLAVSGLLFLAPGCAKDALKGSPELAQNIKITAVFKDKLETDVFYFLVFNFTNANDPQESLRPEPNVSGLDRGKNWEMYIVFHHYAGFSGPTWQTRAKRPGEGNFWVDELANPLAQQFFFLNASAGGNSITVELDPLELVGPNNETPSRFILDIMTADAGIDKETNPDDLGIVYDWIDEVIVVPIEVGTRIVERELLYEEIDDSTIFIPGSDLVDYTITVN